MLTKTQIEGYNFLVNPKSTFPNQALAWSHIDPITQKKKKKSSQI